MLVSWTLAVFGGVEDAKLRESCVKDVGRGPCCENAGCSSVWSCDDVLTQLSQELLPAAVSRDR